MSGDFPHLTLFRDAKLSELFGSGTLSEQEKCDWVEDTERHCIARGITAPYGTDEFRAQIQRADFQTRSKTQLTEDSEVTQISPTDVGDGAEIQSTYDDAYRHALLGAAPPLVYGENLNGYERRLLRPLQPLSKQYAKSNLNAIGDAVVFRHVASEIRKDAIATARTSEGPLRAVVGPPDGSGRRITRYFGDPREAWLPFTPAPRYARFLEPGKGRI
jgi:hypothetical protein